MAEITVIDNRGSFCFSGVKTAIFGGFAPGGGGVVAWATKFAFTLLTTCAVAEINNSNSNMSASSGVVLFISTKPILLLLFPPHVPLFTLGCLDD